MVDDNKSLQVSSGPGESIIERLAANKDLDIEKLKVLRDMYNDELAREAKRQFDEAYVRMKPKLPKVLKTHWNEQTKSKHAKLEDINQIIDPIIEPFGFATATDVIGQTETSVTVEAQLIHNGGHTKKTPVTMPLDNKGPQGTVNKTGPHATSSSITYAKRVAICALLNISTGDDADGNLPNSVITNEQAAEIDLRVKEFEDDYRAKFLSYMKTEKIQDILAKDYKRACNALDAKKKATKIDK